MILEEVTFATYGYKSTDLSPQSKKLIFVQCVLCKNNRCIAKYEYINSKSKMCFECFKKQPKGIRNNDVKTSGNLKLTGNKKRNKYTYYEIECNCGTIRYMSHAVLLRNPTYCGNNCDLLKKYKPVGDLSSKYWNNLTTRSLKKGIIVEITMEYSWNLFLTQNKKCKLSGIDLVMNKKNVINTASLDRIDSKKGYTEGNVQWVHRDINQMKMEFSDEYFIEMCKKIAINNS